MLSKGEMRFIKGRKIKNFKRIVRKLLRDSVFPSLRFGSKNVKQG